MTIRLKQPQATAPLIRKQDGNWAGSAKEKALAFAEHIKNVFTPHPGSDQTNDIQIHEYLEAPLQLSRPIKAFSPNEVVKILMHNLNPEKSCRLRSNNWKATQRTATQRYHLSNYHIQRCFEMKLLPLAVEDSPNNSNTKAR